MDDNNEFSDELRLLAPDGQTPEEVTGDQGDFKLPLSEQEREEVQRRLRLRKLRRFSIAELMVVTTVICVLIAVSTWIPIHVFSLILGLISAIAVAVASMDKLDSRITFLILFTLISSYLVSVIVAVVQINLG